MQSSDDEIGQQHAGQSSNSTKVSLDLRGQRLSLEREALMELPESVLLCLFPNGVVLSPQRQPRLDGGGNGDGQDDQEEEEDVYFVDVSLFTCAVLVIDAPLHSTSLASLLPLHLTLKLACHPG